MAKSFVLTWGRDAGNIAGCKDILPLLEFKREVKDADRFHRVLGRRGGEYIARYRLSVSGRRARLNYTAFTAFNTKADMELGVLELQFDDARRTKLKTILWDRRPLPQSEVAATIADVSDALVADVVTAQQRKLARVLLRKGQQDFRFQLDRVYGGQCCITGCRVPWAIDAAHITPFSDKPSNTISNGLLLRRDIHALFDVNHIGIEPRSHRVRLSSEVRSAPEYRSLHDRRILKPHKAHRKHGPSFTALKARWQKFKASTA
jgi:predicted restriction endonuclease